MNFLNVGSLFTRPHPVSFGSLNPQPLPPGPPDPDRSFGVSYGDRVSLNPQPLPPGPPDPDLIAVRRPRDTVSLNPQPLPPRHLFQPFTVLSGTASIAFDRLFESTATRLGQ